MRFAVGSIAAAAAILVLLAGCTESARPSGAETPTPAATAPGTPTATPTRPTPSPTATRPGATPEPEAPHEIAAIRITGPGVMFEGADGTVYEFASSFGPPSALLDALKDALGITPVPYPSSEPLYRYVEAGTTAWDFGGLIVADQGAGGFGGRRFKIMVTVASIEGVQIVTPGGFTVGDPIADTTALFGQEPSFYEGMGTSNSFFEGAYTMDNPKMSVVAEGASTTITLIIAPTGG